LRCRIDGLHDDLKSGILFRLVGDLFDAFERSADVDECDVLDVLRPDHREVAYRGGSDSCSGDGRRTFEHISTRYSGRFATHADHRVLSSVAVAVAVAAAAPVRPYVHTTLRRRTGKASAGWRAQLLPVITSTTR